MRRASRVLLPLLLVALSPAAAVADTASDIGAATAVTTLVTAARSGDNNVPLKTGDKVFQDETIATDANGIGQFEFRDRTRLAIGPSSTIVLDRFVYDGGRTASKVVINLSKGAFRFMTGGSAHDAYEIKTATATIGVRGTAFDVYVADNGELAVAMLSGSVEVCPLGHACRLHGIVGQFLQMTADGVFSLHDKWDASLFGGVGLKAALPFLADQRILLPALRGQSAIMRRYTTATADALGKTGEALGKASGGAVGKAGKMFFKLPKLKLR
jgi:hypothetical protein